jgi:hypothetical protein
MNLRLGPEAEQALRATAARTGRSQQDLIREAVDVHLGLLPARRGRAVDHLERAGIIGPPNVPYRRVAATVSPPPEGTSLDLLGRDDRF